MAKADWRCGASRTLPIDTKAAWDGPAAAKRMLDAAGIGGSNPRPETAKRGFLLYDAANADLRGSYKLPFADRVGGELKAVRGGVRAAASRLPQTDAPQREKDRARQILDHYEKRFAEADKEKGAGAFGFRAERGEGRLLLLGQRLFNRPLLLHPGKAEIILAAVGGRFGVRTVRGEAAAPESFAAALEEEDGAEPRPYQVESGIAVIPVRGTLTHRLGSLRPFSGMTGYDGIAENLRLALADDAVRAVVFDIDSPGGEVSGCFELADAIFAARGAKPIWAILDDCAFSAAYAVASSCDRVVVPELGAVGSIGVIALIADTSRALEAAGITVNVIQFGARKADGLETMPLSDEARARFQADVDVMGARFAATVARNRGIEQSAVEATEAATFLGQAGVARGLADAVLAPGAAYRALLDSL